MSQHILCTFWIKIKWPFFLPFFSFLQVLPSLLPSAPSMSPPLPSNWEQFFFYYAKYIHPTCWVYCSCHIFVMVTITAFGEVCICTSFVMNLTHFVKNCKDFILSLDSIFLHCWHTLHLPLVRNTEMLRLQFTNNPLLAPYSSEADQWRYQQGTVSREGVLSAFSVS